MFLQASRLWARVPRPVRPWILPVVLVLIVTIMLSFIPVVSANVPGMKVLSSAVRRVLGMSAAPSSQKPAPTFSFTVKSTPSGAAVQVDGRAAGKTPVTLKLTAGNHKLTISRSGYAPETRTVLVRKGGAASLSVRLSVAALARKPAVAPAPAAKPAPAQTPAPARPAATLPFTVKSTPSGATVQVDGQTAGKTPLTLKLAAGNHKLTISRSGYTPVNRTVTVKKGGPASLAVTLSAVTLAPKPKAAPAPAAAPAPPAASMVKPLNAGARAPAITLKDSLGRQHTLNALRGRKVVVLFVWSLDARSRSLIQELDRHVQSTGEERPALVVLAGTDAAAVQTYVATARLRVPLLVGGEATARAYGVARGTTVLYVVSEAGLISQHQIGRIMLTPLFPRPRGSRAADLT